GPALDDATGVRPTRAGAADANVIHPKMETAARPDLQLAVVGAHHAAEHFHAATVCRAGIGRGIHTARNGHRSAFAAVEHDGAIAARHAACAHTARHVDGFTQCRTHGGSLELHQATVCGDAAAVLDQGSGCTVCRQQYLKKAVSAQVQRGL